MNASPGELSCFREQLDCHPRETIKRRVLRQLADTVFSELPENWRSRRGAPN
jgi:hypothetical protein